MVRRRDRYTHRWGKWPATAYAILRTLRHEKPLDLVVNGQRMPVWVVFIGNGRYIPRGLAPSWREHLASGVLDVQYLRADRRFSRTRAVVYSLLGIVERTHVYGSLESAKVSIESNVRAEGNRARRRDHRAHRGCRTGDLRTPADRVPRPPLVPPRANPLVRPPHSRPLTTVGSFTVRGGPKWQPRLGGDS